MRKILYTLNGKLCIVTPVRNTHPVAEHLTDEEVEQRAISRLPEGVNYFLVDESVIPKDRTNRDSWTFDGQEIKGA